MKILDCGAGIGRWTKELSKHFPDDDIIALDYKKRLPKIKGVKFVKGSVEKLPFKDDEFDLVIVSRVLPYVDLNNAVRELERVTKKEGVIIYELIEIGYYLQKLLKGNLKRIVNFINWWFYANFESKLFSKFDNIDSKIMITYYSGYPCAESLRLKSWGIFPVLSLLFMNDNGKVNKKVLHNKIKKIAKDILNEET